MEPVTKQSLKLLSIFGVCGIICATLGVMAMTDSFPSFSKMKG